MSPRVAPCSIKSGRRSKMVLKKIPIQILAPRDRPEYQPCPTSNSFNLTQLPTHQLLAFSRSNFQLQTPQPPPFQLPNYPTSQLPNSPTSQLPNSSSSYPHPHLHQYQIITEGEVWRGRGSATLQKPLEFLDFWRGPPRTLRGIGRTVHVRS